MKTKKKAIIKRKRKRIAKKPWRQVRTVGELHQVAFLETKLDSIKNRTTLLEIACEEMRDVIKNNKISDRVVEKECSPFVASYISDRVIIQ